MEHEVVHVERIDTAALARAVQEFYHGKLERELWEERGLSGRQIDPFQLSGSIVDAIEHFRKQDPERIERLWQRILGYRALLAAYRLRDEAVRTGLEHAPARRRVARSRQAIVGLPLFAYGAAVQLPAVLPTRVARGPDGSPGDGLRDNPAPHKHRRVPALLGARDGAGRMGCRVSAGRSPSSSRFRSGV